SGVYPLARPGPLIYLALASLLRFRFPTRYRLPPSGLIPKGGPARVFERGRRLLGGLAQVKRVDVKPGGDEKQCVDAVEHAAMAGDQTARILDAEGALDQRLDQIA